MTSSSQTPNLTPAENVLRRARGGLLANGEPLVLYYLGPIAVSDWSKWFDLDLIESLGTTFKDKCLSCYLGDGKDQIICILEVIIANGIKMAPNVGSVIACIHSCFVENYLVVKKYEEHNIDVEMCLNVPNSQTPNLTPDKNALSRARAGVLTEGEPLVLYYLGEVTEADWSQWFDLKVVASLGIGINDKFILPCYLSDGMDKLPCIILISIVNGTKMVPNVGSVITCSAYDIIDHNILVKIYEDHNMDIEECKKVTKAFAKTKTRFPRTDDVFLKEDTINSMLLNAAPDKVVTISAYSYLVAVRLNLEQPQYARRVLFDREESFYYFNINHNALMDEDDSKRPYVWVSPGLFLVTSFYVNAKFEIYLECRRVTESVLDLCDNTCLNLDLPVSECTEWYVGELNLLKMLEKVSVKLQSSLSCVEIVPDMKGGDDISYEFTQVENRPGGVYNIVIRHIASHSPTTQPEHRHSFDTSELVGYTTVDLIHQRYVVKILANDIRRVAYSAMVSSAS